MIKDTVENLLPMSESETKQRQLEKDRQKDGVK